MSLSQRGGSLGEEEVERVSALVVRHILFKHHSHPRVPVPREDLVKVAQEQYPHQRGVLALVMKRVHRMFRDILGFDLLDASPPPANTQESSQGQQSLASAKSVVLRSRLDQQILKEYVLREDTAQQMGLRLTVCTLVKGAGGSIEEDALWNLLGKLGVKRDSKQHPAFGDVAEEVKLLEKEKFIVLRKGRGEKEDESILVELGPRAGVEFPGETLKNYYQSVCETNKV